MNQSFCNQCQKLVKATKEERDNKVYLVKDCRDCGRTETLISSDAGRYNAKSRIDGGYNYKSCELNCLSCQHGKQPSLVFVDVTNRCNLDCPICINNTPSMGFVFDPPKEYFQKIFEHVGKLDPKPSLQLFGGEPTVRRDLFDLIRAARKQGLPTRVVTNGLKLADEDYAREMVRLRATVMLAYDGDNPETYKLMRNSEKSLELKLKALENLSKAEGAKVTLMTLVAKGFNDHELPEMLQLCHRYRHFIRAIYLMPLAHMWDENEFDLKADRMTSEEVENIVNSAFPDERIEFMPAGFIGEIVHLLDMLGSKPWSFVGVHPNCESVTWFIESGEGYVPLSRYLKGSVYDLALALKDLDRRVMARGASRTVWNRALALFGLMAVVRRQLRLREFFKGRGLGKVGHLLATVWGMAIGRRSARVLEQHSKVQGTLQIICLPFEDKENIETERLERCATAFAHWDPEQDRVKFVPTCSWALFKTQTMKKIADYYQARGGVSDPV